MKFPSALLTLIGVSAGFEIQLKGTCDNAMTVWLSQDGSDDSYQELTGWSGNLDNWPEVKSLTTDITSLSAKIKIQCRNADNECQGSAGGFVFSVGYDDQWYSTNGAADNDGYYALIDSKSGITTVVDPGYNWGVDLGVPASWTWTCSVDNGWDCSDVCGEYNTYVFDFAVIDPCTNKECTDGNVCNGEEYCDSSTGKCVSGNAIECPFDFVCSPDAQGCVRDCTMFAIDGYLRDCSAEFDENENELLALDERITSLEDSVATIATDVSTNTEDIATNQDDIGNNSDAISANADGITSNDGAIASNTESIGINAGAIATNVESIATNNDGINTNADGVTANQDAITALQDLIAEDTEAYNEYVAATDDRFKALEERLHGMGPVSDLGEGSGDNQLKSPKEKKQKGVFGDMHWFSKHRDEWIVVLLISNVMLFACLFCKGITTSFGPRKKYAPVDVYSSTDESAALQDNKI